MKPFALPLPLTRLLGAAALCASIASLMITSPMAVAQTSVYPARAITLIAPYPPGGTTDIAARVIAQAMGPFLNQSVVVENRPGASGNIGMTAVKRAAPDGYTLGMGTISSQTINQFLFKDMPFDPAQDFVPLIMVLSSPNVVVVRKDSDIQSLADLLTRAQARKDQPISYGSPGIGTSPHLTGAYLEQALGIDMLHVPFKGVANSMPAVIGGQVDVLMDNLPSSFSQLKDGSRLRALAVTSAERSPSLPDVPTVAESGFPDFNATAWFALYAPAGTPAPIQATLIAAAQKALATEAVKTQFAALGATAGSLAGAELSAFEAGERARWAKLIRDLEIAVN